MMKKWKLANLGLSFLLVAGVTLLFPNLGFSVCSNGITAQWKLDEVDGLEGYRDSIGKNIGSGSISPIGVPTAGINGAQRFNGLNSGIDVPASSTFNWLRKKSFSIEFWVNTEVPGVPSNNQVVIGRNTTGASVNWWIGLAQDTGNASFFFRDSLGATANAIGVGPSLSDGKPHHVVLVRELDTIADELTFYFYVDGELIAVPNDIAIQDFTLGLVSQTIPLTIGYFNAAAPDNRFAGLIDEVALYNRALLPDEIKDHYDAGRDGNDYCVTVAPYPDRIAAYWNLDDDDDLGVYEDAIGNNDGSGSNSPEAVPTAGINGAQRFNGVNSGSGIDVPASSTFNWLRKESFSIEFWANTEVPVVPLNDQVVIGRNTTGASVNWWIGLAQGTGNASFFFRDSAGVTANAIGSGPPLSDGKPHHVVLVRELDTIADELTFYFYVDGELIAVPNDIAIQDFTQGLVSLTIPLTIGYFNATAPGNRFAGLIDEVALYNRALLPDEIKDHYDAGVLGKSILSLRPDPVADAGGNQEVTAGEEVTLDGNGSTGTGLTFLWEQVGTGIQVTLEDADTATATFTAPPVDAAGASLTFRLTVTDNDGRRDSDTVIVQVVEAVMPVADAGSDQTVTAGDPVTLDGSGSTGSGLTFLWVQIGDPAVTLAGATSDKATFTAPTVDAALTFRLTVTDDKGQTSSDTVQVTVSAGSTPPPPPPTSSGGGGGGCFINTML